MKKQFRVVGADLGFFLRMLQGVCWELNMMEIHFVWVCFRGYGYTKASTMPNRQLLFKRFTRRCKKTRKVSMLFQANMGRYWRCHITGYTETAVFYTAALTGKTQCSYTAWFSVGVGWCLEFLYLFLTFFSMQNHTSYLQSTQGDKKRDMTPRNLTSEP